MKDPSSTNIKRAIAYLARQKNYHGGSSYSLTTWKPTYSYATTFVPSLILNCLSQVPDAEPVCHHLGQLLLVQRSDNWSFNYWRRHSEESQAYPYPDDLDDTFCALIGLYRHNPKLISADALGRVVHLLLANETAIGGPYRTWLATSDSETSWRSVDLAVNANVAYFLSLVGSPSPPLLSWLESKIMGGDYRSEYYPTNFPIWYYLARSCPASCRSKLLQDIQGRSPSNNLELALYCSALKQLGAPVKALQQKLQAQQRPDGSWPAAAFCLDPSRNGRQYYHGSPALTTAFAIEALQPPAPATKPINISRGRHTIQTAILAQAQRDFSRLQPDLQQQATTLLQKIVGGDTKQQITLLAYDFAQSLQTPLRVTRDFYVNLGLANLYGWMAYTVYDDFLDQAGEPISLPAANLTLCRSLSYFERALPRPDFQRLVQRTFDTIDTANTWELQNCRSRQELPQYGQGRKLAERSLGHTLTPVAILLQAGHPINGPTVKATQRALRHYLIARQLGDDMHDWQEDYRHGHMSSVVTTILRAPRHHDMSTEFWYYSLPKICQQMQNHLQTGRRELAKVPILRADNVIAHLFDEIEASIHTTIRKQEEAREFIASYRQKPSNY